MKVYICAKRCGVVSTGNIHPCNCGSTEWIDGDTEVKESGYRSDMRRMIGVGEAWVLEGDYMKFLEYIKEEEKLMTGQEWYDKFKELAPEQLTEADELDFNLHDQDPEGNCYYAYNCAIADMNKAALRAARLEEE